MRALTRPIAAAMHHVARAHLRMPACGRATLQRDGAPDVRIRLGNISRAGIMGETDAPLRAGMKVRLVLPFGRVVGGTVRWSLHGRFGCQLDAPFRGRDLLAIPVMAGARVSSLVLLAALFAALFL